jgi:hypothetical protein
MPDDSEREEILAEMAALARKLAPDPAAQLNDELAGLREEVAGLRQQLAQHHGCCHHSCWHYCPTVFTTGTWTSGGYGNYTITTTNTSGTAIA